MASESRSRILVVEDEASWQVRLREILHEAGEYDVTVVDSYKTAMEALEAGEHDLVLLDMRLVEWDSGNVQGLDILEKLVSQVRTATIVVTGHATPEIMKECYEKYGVSTVLLKSRATPSEYRDAVHKALREVPARGKKPSKGAPSKLREEAAVQPEVASGAETPAGRRLVLVVEDEREWQQRLVSLIEEMGFQTVADADYMTALGRLEHVGSALAVVDLRLDRFEVSNFDGLNVLLTCRQLGIPTIVVSGVITPDLAQKVYREYAVQMGFQKKYFDKERFQTAVREAVEKGATLLPSRRPTPNLPVQVDELRQEQFQVDFGVLRDFVLEHYKRAKRDIDDKGRARIRLGERYYEADERWWRENATKLDAEISEIWALMGRIRNLEELRKVEGGIRDRCAKWPVWWQES